MHHSICSILSIPIRMEWFMYMCIAFSSGGDGEGWGLAVEWRKKHKYCRNIIIIINRHSRIYVSHKRRLFCHANSLYTLLYSISPHTPFNCDVWAQHSSRTIMLIIPLSTVSVDTAEQCTVRCGWTFKAMQTDSV